MSHSSLLRLASVAIGMLLSLHFLPSCVNGMDQHGSHVNPEQIGERDTVATLSPSGHDFFIREDMARAEFPPYFEATVDEKGHVQAQFKPTADSTFTRYFAADCPSQPLTIQPQQGRCVGIYCDREGTLEQGPMLVMLMDDTHAESISLRSLSEGIVQSPLRSLQDGLIGFIKQSHEGLSTLYGIQLDSTKVAITWQSAE